jgi:hypothetical protein
MVTYSSPTNVCITKLTKKTSLKDSNWTVLATQWKMCLFHGGGSVKIPVFEFWAMFQSLIDDPRLCNELLIDWNNPSSNPPYDKDYLDEIHSMESLMNTGRVLRASSRRSEALMVMGCMQL